MATIQVSEHQRLRIRKSGEAFEGPSLSEKQSSLLERADLPSKALEWYRRDVKFSSYCGVIALGKDLIEVLPKIDRVGGSDDVLCRTVLVRMLAEVGYLKLHTTGSADLNLQKHHLFDLFVEYFCKELFKQLHQGFIKTYVTHRSNRSSLKGKLLIGEQIRKNSIHKERFYCEYDEFVVDNSYNQVIKAVLQLLNRRIKGSRVKRSLNELLLIFDDVTLKAVTVQDVDRLPKNRMVSRYNEVFRLCRMFLSGFSPDVISGKEQAPSLLFNMNQLFEGFVASRLSKIAGERGLTVKAQKPMRYLATDQGGNERFRMMPDITVWDGDRLVQIIDTKWKVLDVGEKKFGVSQSDMYQMCAYAQRYGCGDITLLYPWHEDVEGVLPEFVVQGSDVRVKVKCVDLSRLVSGKGGCDRDINNILNKV